MCKKIAIAGMPFQMHSVIKALFTNKGSKNLSEYFLKEFSSNELVLTGSGTSAFYVFLQGLKQDSFKTEVIVPAYTAVSVIIAIRKSGLKPVLCDVSLKDFNMDIAKIADCVNEKTLCIVPTHLFGIISSDIISLRHNFLNTVIVEDCAQSMGSTFDHAPAGSFGDASFFSFSRGKNIPAWQGGALIINNSKYASAVKSQTKTLALSPDIVSWMKVFILMIVSNPWIYSALYPLISKFKDKAPASDFTLTACIDHQAALVFEFCKKIKEFSRIRSEHGRGYIEAFKKDQRFVVPDICDNSQPAFNRFPLLVKDLNLRLSLEKKLCAAGFETSRMYDKPLHMMFDLGYKQGQFPNAEYVAQHMLTLPTHPLLSVKQREQIITIIKNQR